MPAEGVDSVPDLDSSFAHPTALRDSCDCIYGNVWLPLDEKRQARGIRTRLKYESRPVRQLRDDGLQCHDEACIRLNCNSVAMSVSEIGDFQREGGVS